MLFFRLWLSAPGDSFDCETRHVFQKQVSGDSTMFLGQERELWRPLVFTTVNLSDISR